MKAISTVCWVVALIISTSLTSAQIFPQQSGTGPSPATNILTSIPDSGVLRIEYDFFTIPDTLDVYYNNTDIFSSGPVQNSGVFSVPYGPGQSSSLTIVINQDGGNFVTSWQYIPSVVPIPEPGTFGIAMAGAIAAGLRWRLRRVSGAKTST